MLTPFEHSNHVAKYNIPEKLEIWTTCGPDDEFSSPKQIRYSSVLGKLLVANGYIHIRNIDISYYSKYGLSNMVAVDADASNIYACRITSLYKYSTLFGFIVGSVIGAGSIRMIDASGDPDNVYVTSNNTGDGHGVRKVRKSDMTVVASLLATGAGDGQFSNPLGVKYYDGYVYVCDFDNLRVVKLDASDLSFVANFYPTYNTGTPIALRDIDTDGTNWFGGGANFIVKYDMSFAEAGVVSDFGAGQCYSLCLVGDNLAVCSNTNSNLKLHAKSDLSLISTVGSSGDGSASLFDPRVDFPSQYTGHARWDLSDGMILTATSGSEPSWNGFSGYTFQAPGPHRVRLIGVPVAELTRIDASSDYLTGDIGKIRWNLYRNLEYLYLYSTDVSGDISNLAGLSNLRNLHLYSTDVSGDISNLAGLSNLEYLYLHSTSATCGATFTASWVGMRNFQVQNCLMSQAAVGNIIWSIHNAKDSFTYATPELNVGGTNAAPAGNVTAPIEGADWHDDGGTWIPLTAGAMIWDLAKDVNLKGFKKWTITYNGGVASP